MDTKTYHELCSFLLLKHYSTPIGETKLNDHSFMESLFHVGINPYVAVNEVAQNEKLCRTDLKKWMNLPRKKPLTELDEISAMIWLEKSKVFSSPDKNKSKT